MYQQVVEEVSSTTGYDRVMMYKFHEDMHGEVRETSRIVLLYDWQN
jgi:light-regulated signal transduction histidine kinase (bacteriophytochrome)